MKPVIIIAIAFVLLIPVSAFAQSDNITIKHWFISGWDSCSNRNEQSLNFYETLTPQYLSKYDIHGVQTPGKCVTVDDFQNDIDGFNDALVQFDLPIIILDSISGFNYLLETDALGHYKWQGNNQVIIVSSLSPYVESDTGAWTLSHELAHFALNHKSYPMSIVGEWVHDTESQARSCLDEDFSINTCPELWTTVKAPSGKNIKMMKIYTSDSESIDNPTVQNIENSFQCFSYYTSNKFIAAIICYEIFLISNPTDTIAMSALGRSFEGNSEYTSALNIFQKINLLEPNNAEGLTGIARNHISLGQCEKAIPYYEKTLSIDPTHIEAKTYINLASILCPNNSPIPELFTPEPTTTFDSPEQSQSDTISKEKMSQMISLFESKKDEAQTKISQMEKSLSGLEYQSTFANVELDYAWKFKIKALDNYEIIISTIDELIILANGGNVEKLEAHMIETNDIIKIAGETMFKDVEQVYNLIDNANTLEEQYQQQKQEQPKQEQPKQGGGCLIATATYGSELAPQVQQLRELRDNSLLNTESGTSFMESFNDFYYSFSPIIADYERENPIFKEIVKIVITPMISSLSILNYVDIDSEVEVLGYGISLILLNVGMYFGIPAIVILKIKKKF